MDTVFLNKLRDLNCDVEGALDRCVNDEGFYLQCVRLTLEDEGFSALGAALEEQDTESAFEYAHTLKGVVANVGLTPLYDLLVPIVESLRVGDAGDLSEEYEKLMEERERFRELIF